MTNTTYSRFTINDLDEFSFIAGAYQEIFFDVYTSAGSPVDITSASCLMVVSKYGDQSNSILQISGSPVVSGSVLNQFVVELESSDTKELSGKYIYQPVIQVLSGDEYRPSQGIVTIIPRIPLSSD
jgi:hypothetical protein